MSLRAWRVSAVYMCVAARNGRLRTFDGRVIFVDEVALDELDGQTTLSDTTATDYDELVFPEELRCSLSADVSWFEAPVLHGRTGKCQWLRRAAGGGACILLTPLRRTRMCSEGRENEASGRFASHGRLKGIDRAKATARQGMRSRRGEYGRGAGVLERQGGVVSVMRMQAARRGCVMSADMRCCSGRGSSSGLRRTGQGWVSWPALVKCRVRACKRRVGSGGAAGLILLDTTGALLVVQTINSGEADYGALDLQGRVRSRGACRRFGLPASHQVGQAESRACSGGNW